MTCARLAVTPGEPAGVGPELLIQLIQSGYPQQLVAFADVQLLEQRAKQLGLPLRLHKYQADAPSQPTRPGELTVANVALHSASRPGQLDIANSTYVLETLNRATAACLQGDCQALVTGPVHKGIINDAGVPFSGHTEYLAERCRVPLVVMMLATEGLRVALATTHLPLREVADHITVASLREVIGILHSDLQYKFGITDPQILVAGLNPHAGEGGHLGNEELLVIEPVLQQCRQQGMNLLGPLPADTLFTDKYLQQADAVLAMYHDQGLPVLKYKGFGKAVNITLGLPFIRSSVDHGTALDLAGTGQASMTSLMTALDYAATMLENCRSKV